MGSLRAVGGAIEMTAGAALCAVPVIGPVMGGIVIAHGADTLCTGIRELYYNRALESTTVQLLVQAGCSSDVAHIADGTLSVVGTAGGLRAAANTARSSLSAFKLPAQSANAPVRGNCRRQPFKFSCSLTGCHILTICNPGRCPGLLQFKPFGHYSLYLFVQL